MSGSSKRVLLYRGWAKEADEVAQTLTAVGIASEQVETIVPAIIGGNLMVCEVFVQATDWAAGDRAVAATVGGRKKI